MTTPTNPQAPSLDRRPPERSPADLVQRRRIRMARHCTGIHGLPAVFAGRRAGVQPAVLLRRERGDGGGAVDGPPTASATSPGRWGAIFFGRLGDRIGRRKVLFYTIALMGAATTLIGVLPTYTRRAWRPSCWWPCACCRGFGAGAESAVPESCSPSTPRQATRASSPPGGIWAPTAAPCSPSAIWAHPARHDGRKRMSSSWGWRIPFIASAVADGVRGVDSVEPQGEPGLRGA